ncbi:1,5-anhydro-D-fructose reductase-like [Oppia nitens]|uniref:1,5-anhydro-D-fructose reductase-like n=1 Tax=Oppia nitens TaxID=1686743 RepID=UPI0023DCAC83|nr:1,5-anhydro-D-fructose reductase-like [Oppia nitens]
MYSQFISFLFIIFIVLIRKTNSLGTHVVLNDGNKMPTIAIGTGGTGLTSRSMVEMIKNAVNSGYRHIDTAFIYNNEYEIGIALSELIDKKTINREDIFITTKIWNTYHSYNRVREAVSESLTNLNVDYLDLVLINWPMGYKEGIDTEPLDQSGYVIPSSYDYLETWGTLEQLVSEGKIKSIGVSNFNSEQLSRLLESAQIKPVVNQIESHPHLVQDKLIDFCHKSNIHATAYSPLGGGRLLYQTPELTKIANKYKKSVAQIMIKFQIERGLSVVPKSVVPQHIKENINVFDFTLSAEDIKQIKNLNHNIRYTIEEKAKNHIYYPFHNDY